MVVDVGGGVVRHHVHDDRSRDTGRLATSAAHDDRGHVVVLSRGEGEPSRAVRRDRGVRVDGRVDDARPDEDDARHADARARAEGAGARVELELVRAVGRRDREAAARANRRRLRARAVDVRARTAVHAALGVRVEDHDDDRRRDTDTVRADADRRGERQDLLAADRADRDVPRGLHVRALADVRARVLVDHGDVEADAYAGAARR